jgi:hypothetical protein
MLIQFAYVSSPRHLLKPNAWVILPMPTILRRDGFEVRIYLPPREHPPPHVHVIRGDGEVTIVLGSETHPPRLREIHGMKNSDVVRAYRIVNEHREYLVLAWRAHHGAQYDG